MTEDTATFLRSIPTLAGIPPAFDVSGWATDPGEQFLRWLRAALSTGVAEPHAAVLSTIDDHGGPDARALILKDVDAYQWSFAGLASSGKGRQLSRHPSAALTFWWQPVVRSVRVRGAQVVTASPEESADDLAARSASARSDVKEDDWTLWRLIADSVEFWQGSADRRHTRVIYTRINDRWALSASRGTDVVDGVITSNDGATPK